MKERNEDKPCKANRLLTNTFYGEGWHVSLNYINDHVITGTITHFNPRFSETQHFTGLCLARGGQKLITFCLDCTNELGLPAGLICYKGAVEYSDTHHLYLKLQSIKIIENHMTVKTILLRSDGGKSR